jgi:hypothetical protein
LVLSGIVLLPADDGLTIVKAYAGFGGGAIDATG